MLTIGLTLSLMFTEISGRSMIKQTAKVFIPDEDCDETLCILSQRSYPITIDLKTILPVQTIEMAIRAFSYSRGKNDDDPIIASLNETCPFTTVSDKHDIITSHCPLWPHANYQIKTTLNVSSDIKKKMGHGALQLTLQLSTKDRSRFVKCFDFDVNLVIDN